MRRIISYHETCVRILGKRLGVCGTALYNMKRRCSETFSNDSMSPAIVWHSHFFEGNFNTLFGSEARAPISDFRLARVLFQVRVVMLE